MPKRKKRSSSEAEVGPSDFAHADLGDERRTSRLLRLAEAFAKQPSAPFPQQLASSAEQEALYRFLNNELVDPDAIVAAHAEQTVRRCAEIGTVLAIHDTSEFSFSGGSPREGMERFGPARQGFRGHFNLVAAADGSRRPLGVLAAHTWVRDPSRKRLTHSERKKRDRKRTEGVAAESSRWWKLVEEAEARVGGRASLIHLMDAEADSYDVFARAVEHKRRFVIRSGSKPRIVEPWLEEPVVDLRSALDRASYRYEIEVPISKRKASPRPPRVKTHQPREARLARLRIAAMSVRVRKPQRSPWLKARADTIDLNLVYVEEPTPPVGEDPVEWILATTEPVATEGQVRQVVEWYRTRWLIEEFFKALKTGCALESRQLESYDAMRVALATFLPIACQLLALRDAARRTPDAPATDALSECEIDVLRACSGAKLRAKPTLQECLLAVAGWGGHIRNNGAPGWITLARGMKRLYEAVPVWEAAQRSKK